ADGRRRGDRRRGRGAGGGRAPRGALGRPRPARRAAPARRDALV
ncbi:MAG: hypothetical protein AVDCRST_MAG11-2687, partial [uncultured Gemmatimonadaceae bacterium]